MCIRDREYIAKYQELIVSGSAWVSPHIPATTPERLWLSGLELLEQTPEMNFINVGERCNVCLLYTSFAGYRADYFQSIAFPRSKSDGTARIVYLCIRIISAVGGYIASGNSGIFL